MSKILIDEAIVKLSLEALDRTDSEPGSRAFEREEEAITALREALASEAKEQPAPLAKPHEQEPLDSTQISKVWWDGKKLMAKPIPFVEFYKPAQQQSCYCLNCEELSKQVTALKTCLEVERGFNLQEPVQQSAKCGELVAWLVVSKYSGGKRLDVEWNIDADAMAFALGRRPLYTTPQPAQRTWVGLTDEEMYRHCPNWLSQADFKALMLHVEAKLKEKNNG